MITGRILTATTSTSCQHLEKKLGPDTDARPKTPHGQHCLLPLYMRTHDYREALIRENTKTKMHGWLAFSLGTGRVLVKHTKPYLVYE